MMAVAMFFRFNVMSSTKIASWAIMGVKIAMIPFRRIYYVLLAGSKASAIDPTQATQMTEPLLALAFLRLVGWNN